MRLIPIIVFVGVLAFASSGVFAAVIPLEAVIDGAQANAGAGTGSTATGFASMTLDDTSNLFSWNIQWSGLLGTITVAHFHGPAGPGMNAGVQVNFSAISGSTSPSIGSTTISPGQDADLLAGLWYINIHSTLYAGGEIRGQVNAVPEPGTFMLLGIGFAGLLGCGWRRRKRSG